MIRTALLLLVTATVTFGSSISIQSNGSGPMCSGSGSNPTLPGGDVLCTAVTPQGGNLMSDFVIPNANIPDTANGAGGWAAPVGDGATWVSFENTGWVGVVGDWNAVNTVPNTTCPPGTIVKGTGCQPGAEFFEVFSVSSDSTLNLTVWADDTAEVFLINGANSTQLNTTTTAQGTSNDCAPSSTINCTTGTMLVNGMALTPGTYMLEFDVYQTGGAAFGVMYDGDVVDSGGAPEPATCILLSGGLAAMAALRRKRAS
jgi:hypothetical protein